jgi:Flp pilus assembly protein TadG
MILRQTPRRGQLRAPSRIPWNVGPSIDNTGAGSSVQGSLEQTSTPRGGAVTLEFALVLPVLVLLLTGILEFGRIALLGIPMTEAARSGAMYGAMNPPDPNNPSDWSQQCELRAREVLANQAGINASLVTVQCTYNTGSPMNRATVQVTYPFTLLTGWAPAPTSLVIQRTAVFPVIR